MLAIITESAAEAGHFSTLLHLDFVVAVDLHMQRRQNRYKVITLPAVKEKYASVLVSFSN